MTDREIPKGEIGAEREREWEAPKSLPFLSLSGKDRRLMSVGRTGGPTAEIGNLDGWITRGDRRWKIGTGQETSNQNRLREPSPCRIAKTIITGSSNKNMNLIFCYINATSGPRRSPAPTCVEFIMCGPTGRPTCGPWCGA